MYCLLFADLDLMLGENCNANSLLAMVCLFMIKISQVIRDLVSYRENDNESKNVRVDLIMCLLVI